jgi:hypothetical protein
MRREQIKVSVDVLDAEELRAVSRRKGLSLSGLVRLALREWLSVLGEGEFLRVGGALDVGVLDGGEAADEE